MARTAAGSAPGRTNRKFLIVALLFGALTAALFYALTARDSGEPASAVSAGDVQVVVARVPIKQRTTITADMLQVKSIPLNAKIDGAYASVTDAAGKVTKFPIAVNQQVVSASVVDVAKPVTDAALSYVIPTGRRAMSIQASQLSNAGGLILPGDYIDLVWICCTDRSVATKTLLRNVQVAAIAQTLVNSGPVGAAAGSSDAPVSAGAGQPLPDAVTMTLLLSPTEAQQLFLAEQAGKLRAILRNVGDQDLVDTPVTLITEIVPVEALKALPAELRPEGYKQ